MIGQNPLGEGRILIEGEVLAALDVYRQHKMADSEAGGLLLGYRRGPHLHITTCTRPFPTDKRTRTSFKRACAGHAEIANERWRTSEERMDYLGEWHSHPEAKASPSGIDLREWHKLLRNRSEALVFLIVGIDEDWYGIGMLSRIEPMRIVGNEAPPDSGIVAPYGETRSDR